MARAKESASKVWLIRAGRHGEDEDLVLSEGRAIVGFSDIGNLSEFKDVEAVAKAIMKADSEPNLNRANNRARQIWAFYEYAELGDIAVLPLKTRAGQIALGRITGPYQYTKIAGEYRHTRKVDWVKPDVARSTFKQDLLYSFGAFMTICRVKRNDAERRVLDVLSGRVDPGYEGAPDGVIPRDDDGASDTSAVINIAQAAQDDVIAYIRGKFKAHDLARLVSAILQAQGYAPHVSPPGPDGGADILAGRGPLGLDAPTLCVQVKATEAAADVKVFRELIGTMDSFKATQGLLVCWGGFTQPLKNEARQQVFKVRLWDQSDLVNAIYESYDKLSPEIQAELPLKRTWVLVHEDVEE